MADLCFTHLRKPKSLDSLLSGDPSFRTTGLSDRWLPKRTAFSRCRRSGSQVATDSRPGQVSGQVLDDRTGDGFFCPSDSHEGVRLGLASAR